MTIFLTAVNNMIYFKSELSDSRTKNKIVGIQSDKNNKFHE